VTIADDWQHLGLGRLLMTRLIAAARAAGYRVLAGQVLHENDPMQALAHALGMTAHSGGEDPSVIRFEMPLSTAAAQELANA